ncbi:MAG: DcaP family trimeric outer membrane transporter [Halieaceae bacterium]|nr:DcaP family trimeric outer membrane transporter [Halieaceae bacterium]
MSEGPQFSAGGFVKVKWLIGDISESRDTGLDHRLVIPAIPVTDRPDSDKYRMNFHAQDTRFWGRAVQETGLGQLEFYLEADLLDRADAHRPRLRHGYVRLGGLTVGQTFTAFTNTSALEDVDTGFTASDVPGFTNQIRWTQPLGEQRELILAVEEPLNLLHFEGTSNIIGAGSDRRPDLVARLGQRGDWGNVSIAATVREVATTDGLVDPALTESEVATAFSLAGRLATGGADNLRFALHHGDGLPRFLTYRVFADATVEEGGELNLGTTTAASLAWQHFWGIRWRSTFAGSFSRTDPDPVTAPNLTREGRSAAVNLIWTPTTRYSVGVEYLYAWRETVGGEDGDLNRLNFTYRLNF